VGAAAVNIVGDPMAGRPTAFWLNGELHGRVSADRLTINGNGLLADPAQ
jgi:hypothetical protein